MTKRAGIITAVAVAMVAVVGVGVWWFLFRDDAPAEVDIDDAVASLEGEGAGDSGEDASTAAGTWAVDPTIGDFADFSSSFVGYRVEEEIDPIGSNTATARTPEVTGTLVIDGATLTTATIDADLSTLESDSGIRDNQLEGRGLETGTFPDAAFELTEPVDLGAEPEEGVSVTADAVGDLTLHGVTREVTVPMEAELVDGVIAVTGSIDFDMRDFDIEPPTGGPILSVSPDATVEVQLFFTRQ